MFPGFRLSLPPKRWFKDNYDSDFLEDRQLGLQAFLQNVVAHKDIANWYVTWFFYFLFIFNFFTYLNFSAVLGIVRLIKWSPDSGCFLPLNMDHSHLNLTSATVKYYIQLFY